MERALLILGAVSALVAVGAGAFGAHALQGRVAAELMPAFETGARYQMYHALALMGVALAAARWPDGLWLWAGILFVAGTLIFSGSLYALTLSGVRWLGGITPVGGLCFLAGWALAALAAWRAV